MWVQSGGSQGLGCDDYKPGSLNLADSPRCSLKWGPNSSTRHVVLPWVGEGGNPRSEITRIMVFISGSGPRYDLLVNSAGPSVLWEALLPREGHRGRLRQPVLKQVSGPISLIHSTSIYCAMSDSKYWSYSGEQGIMSLLSNLQSSGKKKRGRKK